MNIDSPDSGEDSAWRTAENLGDLLVLIPEDLNHFLAYVLHLDDDIEELQAALGVELLSSWALYDKNAKSAETPQTCIITRFREFVASLNSLPSGSAFSNQARSAVHECVAAFDNESLRPETDSIHA